MPVLQQMVYKLTVVRTYVDAEPTHSHCMRVQCSDGESSSTHLSFAYVVLSASCSTNRQHISHVSIISQFTLRLIATR